MRVVTLAYAVHALVTEPRLEGVRPSTDNAGRCLTPSAAPLSVQDLENDN